MDFNKLMEQAQMMQKQMEQQETDLQSSEYTGMAGEEVSVTMTGGYEVVGVHIKEELLTAENKEMLEDMIMIAVNDVLEQVAAERADKLGQLTGGFDIPGLK